MHIIRWCYKKQQLHKRIFCLLEHDDNYQTYTAYILYYIVYRTGNNLTNTIKYL